MSKRRRPYDFADQARGHALWQAVVSTDHRKVDHLLGQAPTPVDRTFWQKALAHHMKSIPSEEMQRTVLGFPDDWFENKREALHWLLCAHIGDLRTADLQERLVFQPEGRA